MAAVPKVHLAHPGGHLQCMTYLIDGPGGAVLVDPGSGALEDEVLEGIRRAGRSLADVAYALLTHCHVDHALGAYRFRERGVRLVAAPRTAAILRAGGHQVWYEYPKMVVPTEVDLVPEDGEVLDLCGLRITAVHTPGHTDGCASYLVRTDAGLSVFTGDLIAVRGHPSWAGSEGFSVRATMESLEKLIALRPDRAFPAHGVIEGPALDWLRDTLERGRRGEWELHTEFHPDITFPAR